jgi:hypothetical protein
MRKTILVKSILLISLIVLTSFVFNRGGKRIHVAHNPPGTIEIDTNLFVDFTETRNLDYLQFIHWTKQVFGSNSKKYSSILPSVDLWLKEENCLKQLSGNVYFRHPAYRDYPVVGVSQIQTKEYCKWRSDRVFEYILIRNKVIDYNLNQDSNNYFTIEKFYNKEYVDNPYSIMPMYPDYRLPTENEWKKAVIFFNTYNKKRNCRSKHCKLHVEKDSLLIQYNVKSCKGDTFVTPPLKPVLCSKRRKLGTHFYGNVSEWLITENYIIGGSWKDKVLNDFDQPIYANKPSVNIGFRAFCKWKKYKKP